MFEEEIKRINPVRLIDTRKICPQIYDYCIKDKCNAFSLHYDIKIVTLEEKIAYQNKNYDWGKEISINNWVSYSESRSATGPDDQDTLFIKKRDIETGAGRCLIK